MHFSRDDDRMALTPLIDIAFLVLIFFMSLPYKRLDHKLEAHLPKEGLDPIALHEQPPEIVRIRVRRALGDRPMRYELGEHTAATAGDLTPLLRHLGPTCHYEVHADPGVAWQDVVSVVDTLHGLQYEHVRFRGMKAPTSRIRRSMPLPQPDRD